MPWAPSPSAPPPPEPRRRRRPSSSAWRHPLHTLGAGSRGTRSCPRWRSGVRRRGQRRSSYVRGLCCGCVGYAFLRGFMNDDGIRLRLGSSRAVEGRMKSDEGSPWVSRGLEPGEHEGSRPGHKRVYEAVRQGPAQSKDPRNRMRCHYSFKAFALIAGPQSPVLLVFTFQLANSVLQAGSRGIPDLRQKGLPPTFLLLPYLHLQHSSYKDRHTLILRLTHSPLQTPPLFHLCRARGWYGLVVQSHLSLLLD